MSLNESHVEEAALIWFGELGYAIWRGSQRQVRSPRRSISSVFARNYRNSGTPTTT